jgi:NADH-quinone oxidoreductase subunit F
VMTPNQIDTPLDVDSLAQKGLFIGSGVITAIDDRTCIVQFALRIAQFYMHESCGKCTPCRVGTRWLVQLVRSFEEGKASEEDFDLLLDVCDRIIGKCLCVLGDSAAMPVASCVTKFRDEFRAHIEHGGCPFGEDSSLAHLFAPSDQHHDDPLAKKVPV